MIIKTKRVILVNLPFEKIYQTTNLAKMTHTIPPLSLAAMGGSLLKNAHNVIIYDFNLQENTIDKFRTTIRQFDPHFIGISFVTPLFNEMQKITKIIKGLNRNILVIGGGPHCSSFPQQTLEESALDFVIVGEGDIIINNLVENSEFFPKLIRADPIQDLDRLPFPAYHLYEFKKYKVPKSIARKLPAAWMETSRGCKYGCVYCNKNIFGNKFRMKSPERVVDEMINLKRMGIKEVHFTDDAFTTNIARAKAICDLLIKRKLNLDFALINGIRVNQVDYECLRKLKRAGCYKIFFGIESGNQKILNKIKKGITLSQIVRAVDWGKKAGLEVSGLFMIGLPGETKETIQDTIRFAKSLNLDMAKLNIMIPLPGTPIFEEWEKAGYLKTKDWDKFNFHTPPVEVYDHPNLSWTTIKKYYEQFYREFYFRPKYIANRIIRGVKKGGIFDDIKVFWGTKWFNTMSKNK